ncbi:MAG: ABC transporter permease [Lachnospiraceae bacterium]|nr:ABC transporter permease [Lachnospiraceae bacterium]
MLNYIKSDLYRIFHSKGIYVFVTVCSLLLFAMNLINHIANLKIEGFLYGTTDFAFGMVTSSMSYILCIVALFSTVICGDDYKNRTINNSISFGISRKKIYGAKLITALLTSALSLVIILGVLIISGYILLEHSNTGELISLFTAVTACIPALICSLIACLTFYYIFGSVQTMIWGFLGVFVAFPMVISLLALKFHFFQQLNNWLIYSMVSYYSWDENENLVFLWNTTDGFFQLITAGIIGIVIFTIIGIFGIEKKEL